MLLSGCDTVPMMFNIGKAKAISAIKTVPLKNLGNQNSQEDEILAEAKAFVRKCYNAKPLNNMSQVRKILWERKTSTAKLSSHPKLCTLPPTDEDR